MVVVSVVNKMLNDLEKREQAERRSVNYVPSKNSNTNNRIIVFLVGVVLALACLLIWLNINKADDGNTNTAPLANADSSTSVNATQQATNQAVNSKSNTQSASTPEQQGSVRRDPVFVQQTTDKLAELARPKILTASQNASIIVEPSTDTVVQTVSSTESTSAEISTVQTTPSKAELKSQQAPSISSNTGALEVKTSNTSMSVEALEQQTKVALNEGNKNAAKDALSKLISIAPRNNNARKRLASLLFASGNHQQASSVLTEGIALNPDDSSMRMMQARLLFRNEQAPQALSLLQAHPAGLLLDDEYLSFRAALAEKQADYTQSKNDYQVLLQRQPNNARWWLGLAVSHDKQGQQKQANDAYQRVRSLNQLSDQVLAFVESRIAALGG